VVDSAPEELKAWAKVRLQKANRRSFRDGLIELIDDLPPAIHNVVGPSGQMAEKVRITRNYLTTGKSALSATPLMGKSWWR
jgi:hypothetical protein